MLTGSSTAAHLHIPPMWGLLLLVSLTGMTAWCVAQWAYRYARRLWVAFDLSLIVPNPASAHTSAGRYRMAAVASVTAWTLIVYCLNGLSAHFAMFFFVTLVLLALAIVDLHIQLLPDSLTQPLLWTGLAMAWFELGPSLHSAVAGAMVGYGLLSGVRALFYACAGRDGIGGGDVKLAAALGAWLGWHLLLWALLLACLGGALWSLARRKGLRHELAFGPFLAAPASFVMGAARWIEPYL